jgi:anhydro-N-acetylmuramic acid kinase
MYGLGLMSGTSADGISAVLVKLTPNSIEPVLFLDKPFSPKIQTWVLGLGETSARGISVANFELGNLLADAALELIQLARRRGIRVDFIASHGQTIDHSVESTLQIGEPSIIAERTGLTTVADFRPRDKAAGGQGAPLVPYFDHFVFSGHAPCVLLNIGGIANVTLVTGNGKQVTAFDTGPGNNMIDEAVRRATGGKLQFDADGSLASQGELDARILKKLAAETFWKDPPPKSYDRLYFLRGYFEWAVGRELKRRPLDVIATLTYFTAWSIAQQVPQSQEVIAAGGGVYNATLMRHLRSMIFPGKLSSISQYGWNPLAKEAACFALLGYQALRGKPNHLPSATGARRETVLGKIVPGKNYRSLLKRLA